MCVCVCVKIFRRYDCNTNLHLDIKLSSFIKDYENFFNVPDLYFF